MLLEQDNPEIFSNQAIESMFAHLRNLESTRKGSLDDPVHHVLIVNQSGPWIPIYRFTIQSTLSLALITKNRTCSYWLMNHTKRSDIIRTILKSREGTKRNNRVIEEEMFNQRLKLSKNNLNSGK